MKVKCGELVADYDFYPRSKVDSTSVQQIADAMEAGFEMPPIVIDKKSKKIVDGVHRVRATMRTKGQDAEVEAIARSYANDGEMLLDAIRLNASHGNRLSPWDRTRCLLLAKEMSIAMGDLATALNTDINNLQTMMESLGTYRSKPIPIKKTIRHMEGKKFTKAQREANEKLGGLNQTHYANQLILLIEADLLDTENPNLMERLHRLYELLGGVL
jgi:ParB-like chromosome segregation protein Spo0J